MPFRHWHFSLEGTYSCQSDLGQRWLEVIFTSSRHLNLEPKPCACLARTLTKTPLVHLLFKLVWYLAFILSWDPLFFFSSCLFTYLFLFGRFFAVFSLNATVHQYKWVIRFVSIFDIHWSDFFDVPVFKTRDTHMCCACNLMWCFTSCGFIIPGVDMFICCNLACGVGFTLVCPTFL